MAEINGKPVPSLDKLEELIEEYVKGTSQKKSPNVKDLVTNKKLFKITILLGICWLSLGYGFYAFAFGVQSLSGDLYLNIFLLSFVEIPAIAITYFFSNCMGRKWSTFLFFMIASVGSCVVAVVQVSAVPNQTSIVNAFALASKLGLAAGMASLMILTAELYPTVVRNVGFGLQFTVSRIGGMVAPQIVFLNKRFEGLMYFLCSGMMLLSLLSLLILEETKGKTLENTIADKKDPKSSQTITVSTISYKNGINN